MTTIERLKQGCKKVTKRWNCDYEAIWVCGKKRNGNLYLCKECRAKLSQHIEDVEEFKKKMKEIEERAQEKWLEIRIKEPREGIKAHKNTINAITLLQNNWKELKSSLEKDEEKEIGGFF